MEVVLRAEVVDADRGVLDVPSGAALPPRALPRGLPGLVRLPQREVRGVPLVGVHGDAGPGSQLLDLLAAELPPVRVLRGVVVHAPVRGDVREPAIEEPPDLGDNLGHVVGRPRVQVDGVAPERPHAILELPPVLQNNLLPVPARLLHLLDDPVLDVRHVLEVEYRVALVAEVPRHDVEGDVRLRVAYVRGVLRGDSADEHRDAVPMEGDELLLAAGQGVVDPEGHGPVRIRARGIKVRERAAISADPAPVPIHRADLATQLVLMNRVAPPAFLLKLITFWTTSRTPSPWPGGAFPISQSTTRVAVKPEPPAAGCTWTRSSASPPTNVGGRSGALP